MYDNWHLFGINEHNRQKLTYGYIQILSLKTHTKIQQFFSCVLINIFVALNIDCHFLIIQVKEFVLTQMQENWVELLLLRKWTIHHLENYPKYKPNSLTK